MRVWLLNMCGAPHVGMFLLSSSLFHAHSIKQSSHMCPKHCSAAIKKPNLHLPRIHGSLAKSCTSVSKLFNLFYLLRSTMATSIVQSCSPTTAVQSPMLRSDFSTPLTIHSHQTSAPKLPSFSSHIVMKSQSALDRMK